MSGVFTSNGQKTQTALKQEEQENEERKAKRQQRWQGRWRFLRRGFKTTVVLLILGAFLWIFRERIFFSVGSGEVLIVYYRFLGGTNHNQIGHEGLHIVAPWDEAYRYQVRTLTLMNPMTVLARNGLEVHLDAQVRFHPVPELVPYLHRRYGPDYVRTIIKPQLTEAVQSVIGQYNPDELYSSETGASVSRIFENAKRIIGGVYVEVEDIALFNIKLPDEVQKAVQAKAAAEQQALAHAFLVKQELQEAERKAIEARSLQNYATTVSGIPRSVLIWKGIEATLELAKSPNAKVIVFGSKDNLPLMLGNVPDLAAEK
jgi:regulator of protease activity HflC (stomatin/prohibitin superfamily)